MVILDPILPGILIIIALVIMAILFGPSWYSTYRNWKIRRIKKK